MKLEFTKQLLDENSNHYFIVYNNKKEKLGLLYYCIAWKKWVWSQEEEIQMSNSCLQQILNKIGELKDGS